MFPRISLVSVLLNADPAGAAGGGGVTPPPAGQPATPPNPVFQQPPTGAPGGPSIPPTIPLTVDEYQRLRGVERQLLDFQNARNVELETKERERIDALAAKGQAEEALKLTRTAWEQKHTEAITRANEFQRMVLQQEVTRAIDQSLIGRTILGESNEEKLARIAILRDHVSNAFEAVPVEGQGIVVRERATGRPAAQVLAEKWDSTLYGNFFVPKSTTGGAGSGGSRPPANPKTDQPPDPSAAAMLDYIKRQQGLA